MQKKLALLFWLIAAVEIASIGFDISWLQYLTKPLLMPVLCWLLLSADIRLSGNKLVLAALVFSWAGDILLMFENGNPLFFIGGLVCFLTTHILYIIYFLNTGPAAGSLLKRQPWWAVAVAAYAVLLVWLLYPHLKEMKLPVMVYATVISVMLLAAIHVYPRLSKIAGMLFITGAVFFVCSDSLLAINKFYQPFLLAGQLIMFTYCLAQFLIVWGVLQRRKDGQ